MPHLKSKLTKPQLMIIEAEFTYDAPVAKLFDALTVSIHKWWTPDFLIAGLSAKKLIVEPKIGGRMLEVWKGKDEGSLWGIVTEFKKNARLEITGAMGAPGSTTGKLGLDFKAQTSKKSKLVLRHSAHGEVSREELKSFSEGWEFLLGELLRKYLSKR